MTEKRETPDKTKPAAWFFPPRRKQGKAYNTFYLIAEAMLVLSVISAVFGFIPPWKITTILEPLLAQVFIPRAMASVVSFIGFAGIVFAWMVSRVEDRVCGLRMYRIVTWAFPNFFGLYFILYLSLSIVVVYAGNASCFWPAFYAFIGVIVSLGLMSTVCYRIVIRSDLREEYAFDYCEECFRDAKGSQDQIKEVLLNVAEYARMLYITEHRDISDRMVRLWTGLFHQDQIPDVSKVINDPSADDDGEILPSADDGEILARSDMLCRAWAALLPNGLSNYQDMAIFKAIVNKLDEKCPAGDYGKWIVLLGLAQYLIRYCQKSADWNLRFLHGLAYELRGSPAFQELIWAFLSMLSVEWIKDEALNPRKALAEAVRATLPVLDQCMDEAKKESLTISTLYAQNIARSMREMTVISYFVRVARLFQSTTVVESVQQELIKPKNLRDQLVMLCYIAVMEENQTKNEEAV